MWSGLVDSKDGTADEQRNAWQAAMQGVMAVWAEALGNFHRDVLIAAVKDLAVSDSMWPPALPEFVKMCREQEERLKPAPLTALPAPDQVADPESPKVKEARDQLARLFAKQNVTRSLA